MNTKSYLSKEFPLTFLTNSAKHEKRNNSYRYPLIINFKMSLLMASIISFVIIFLLIVTKLLVYIRLSVIRPQTQ
jgi:hypothetical protein